MADTCTVMTLPMFFSEKEHVINFNIGEFEFGPGTEGSGSSNLKNLVDGSAVGSVRGINAAIEDENYTIGENAFAEGNGTKASGYFTHAEGRDTLASGHQAHAEGYRTVASGYYTHAEGSNTKASGQAAHAEGYGGTYTINGVTYESGAKGETDHTEGYQTLTASGGTAGNHAEGYQTQATGGAAHAEGSNTTASGIQSHAEGQSTTASGGQSHVEGYYTTASGSWSHAEGNSTKATGSSSHAEGQSTKANGTNSHAEGQNTIASGSQSHAEGSYTISNHASQHVFGEYNVVDSSTAAAIKRGTYVEIVGNGISSSRSNARTLDWDGNEWLAGTLTVGIAPTNDMDVATKKYVDENAGGGTGNYTQLTNKPTINGVELNGALTSASLNIVATLG